MKQKKENITSIYLVRHSVSDTSVKEDRIRPLSDEGIERIANVNSFFEDICITAVYSSPYKRSYDTVWPYAESIGLNIVVDENLRERKVSDFWIEDFKSFAMKQWQDFDYKLESGESLGEVQTRNIESIRRIIAENTGRNVIVGTHGTAMSTIINCYDNNYGYEKFMEMVDKMPYMVKLVFRDAQCISIEEFEIY